MLMELKANPVVGKALKTLKPRKHIGFVVVTIPRLNRYVMVPIRR